MLADAITLRNLYEKSPWDTSETLCPVTSASVNVESTSGRPHSVLAA